MKTLIILMGFPGSGKSTYAINFFDEAFIINQDAFNGNRSQTWTTFKYYMDQGKDVVLDRCNINKAQRSPWINYAKQCGYKVGLIYLYCDTEICIKRIMERKNHITIKENTPLEKVQEIVNGFNKSYQAPCMTEGFDTISCWRND